jgi:hypothetical protein
MNFRFIPILLATLLSACCEEPRRDPFLASDKVIRDMIPREGLTVQNVTVQFDWISLPHLTANQLIRQHLQRTRDGGPLYLAVQELLAQKKAERLDLTTVLVRGGQRSKTETIVEFPYPTEFDPPQAAEKILLNGGSGYEPISPVTPGGFSFRNTGRTSEVEATISEGGSTIDLNLAPEWIVHLTEISWGSGLSEIKQPVFGTNKLATQMLVQNTAWQLAGLFTPPHRATEGKLPGSAEILPAERVLLFVRASNSSPPKARQANNTGVKQVTVLAEWIETETATAAELLAKFPAASDSPALREALEPMLTDGRSILLESAALQVRGGQRSKIESLTQFPYPTEFDPPGGGHQFIENKPAGQQLLPPPVPAGPKIAPTTPTAIATKNLGHSLEVEATVGADGMTIDMNLAPQLIFNLGTKSWGEGVSESKQPLFQALSATMQVLVLDSQPAMIGCFDAPLPPNNPPPDVKARKVLLFVRGIL